MRIIFLVLFLVSLVGYGYVSTNLEKFANSGNLVSRSILLFSGILFAATGAYFFLQSVADPAWAFGIGFVLGPLLAVAAVIYVLVALLFFRYNRSAGCCGTVSGSNTATTFDRDSRVMRVEGALKWQQT